MLQKNQSKSAALLKYGLSAPLFILMLVLSSATVNESKTVKLINNKVEQVFLLPPSPINAVTVNQPVGIKQTNTAVPVKADTTSFTGKEKIFTSVEHEPEFKGGFTAFAQFLGKNILYPEAMKKDKVQGKVFVTFVVKSDGSLSDIKVIKSIGYGADEETIRVMKLSPKWIPGVQNGHPVNVQYTMPVNFALADDKAVKDTVQKIGKTEDTPSVSNKYSEYSINNNSENKFSINADSHNAMPNTVTAAANTSVKTSDSAGIGPVSGQQAGNMAQGFVLQAVAGTNDKYTIAISGINQANQPLCLLDGKEVVKSQFINADDIKSIDVIKGDNNTIKLKYGPKAKNGVILITSKHPAKD